MSLLRPFPSLRNMTRELPVQRVEVSFVGVPPAQQVTRASGVSEVEIDGATCAVWSAAVFSHSSRPCAVTKSSACGRYRTREGRTVRAAENATRQQPAAGTVRAAGVLYLILVVTGIFGLVGSQSLIVPHDANATAHNIRSSEALFRLALVSSLIAS